MILIHSDRRVASSTGATLCVACTVGNYQPNQGMTVCEECPTGTKGLIAEDGSSSCEACTQGQCQNQTGQSTCILCAAGSTNAYSGHATCELCALGTFALVLGMVTRIAHHATWAIMQTLEGQPSAKAVLRARIKTKLVRPSATPANLEAMQTQTKGLPLASFVGQGPTRWAAVYRLGAQTVTLENIRTRQDRAHVTTAILVSIV